MKSGEFYKSQLFYPTLSTLTGRMLEIGALNKNNVEKLNNVEEIFLLNPEEKNINKLKDSKNTDIKTFIGRCENLPFKDNFFDAVIGSFFLCSVENPLKSLSEIHRVLKNNGKLIVIEHTIAREPSNKILQKVLYYINFYFAGKCRLDSDPEKVIGSSGFSVEQRKYSSFWSEPFLTIIARK